jgi:hypothetical protein
MKVEELTNAINAARACGLSEAQTGTLAAAILQASAIHALAAVLEKINADTRAEQSEKKLTANELRKQWTR